MTKRLNKVLFVPTNKWASWGGSELLWAQACEMLAQTGRIKVGIHPKKWGRINPNLRRVYDSASVYERNEPSILHQLLKRLIGHNRLPPWSEKTFALCIHAFRPDLVVISQGANTDGLEWMESCVKYKLPFITVSQAATESNWPDPPTSCRLRAAFAAAHLNLFVSQHNLKLTELQVGSRFHNAMVVANPFNIPFNSSVAYPGLSRECYQVACVARLELHAKGQDALLEVLADQKWKQRNLVVNLYGDGIDRQNIERLITYFGVKEKAKLAGYLNPLEIWNQNHALILPSRYEGLPLALVEAMLCARASIVTNVGGNGEVVVDGVSGFIAAAPRAIYLDEALERAWLRRTEWEAIGHKAQQHIKTIIPEDPAKVFADLISSFESDPPL